jgi:hypothetical protein
LTGARFVAACLLRLSRPSARFAAQRFFVAAMILFIPSGLILRFGLAASAWAGAGGSASPRIFAHLVFCANAIFRRTAALIFRRFFGADSGVAAVSIASPGKHRSEFGDLLVDPPFLGLETVNGGGDDGRG